MKKATILGKGNVGTHLADALQKIGFSVDVYSPTATGFNPDFSTSDTDILFLCVPDNVIETLTETLSVNPKAIVCHTSGTVSLAVFRNKFEHFGVFYPLQSFSKNRPISFSKIPLLIEANTSEVLMQLKLLAAQLSEAAYEMNSEQRSKVHLAAVFANNFTNVLFSISEKILNENHLDERILYPLIEETVSKAKALGAKNAQTGPAKRNDTKTIEKHLGFLKPEEQKVYKVLTEYIIGLKV